MCVLRTVLELFGVVDAYDEMAAVRRHVAAVIAAKKGTAFCNMRPRQVAALTDYCAHSKSAER